MAISAKDVQKLREMTGVGIMNCKNALVEADGDFDKAIEWLREKGLAAQVKKAGKVAAEGVSYAVVADNGVGVIIEVNSQTDFVAKNEVFQSFVKDVAAVVAAENPADVDALKNCKYPGTDRTIADVTADKVLAIGENIQIRRFVRYAEGVSVPYIHMGGKVGVLVNLAVEGIEAVGTVDGHHSHRLLDAEFHILHGRFLLVLFLFIALECPVDCPPGKSRLRREKFLGQAGHRPIRVHGVF